MQIMIEINEARFKDIQRIAEVQLESNHFQTAEQIIAKGVPIEQDSKMNSSEEPNKSETVLYSGDGYADGEIVYDFAECPRCGYEYEDGDKDWGFSFCPNCGQALKWEVEE